MINGNASRPRRGDYDFFAAHSAVKGPYRLNLRIRPAEGGFHTIAGFMLRQLGHLPKAGEHFDYEGWRFEVVDLDGRRIDKVLAIPPKSEGEDSR